MSTHFDATSWTHAAGLTDAAREDWEQQTWPAVQAEETGGDTSQPIDAALQSHTRTLHLKWYDLIGNLTASLGSDAAKMLNTGENYTASEDAAEQANQRFWSSR